MHSLARDLAIIVLLVEFELRLINLLNGLFQLFESKVSVATTATRRVVALQVEGVFYCGVSLNIQSLIV